MEAVTNHNKGGSSANRFRGNTEGILKHNGRSVADKINKDIAQIASGIDKIIIGGNGEVYEKCVAAMRELNIYKN